MAFPPLPLRPPPPPSHLYGEDTRLSGSWRTWHGGGQLGHHGRQSFLRGGSAAAAAVEPRRQPPPVTRQRRAATASAVARASPTAAACARGGHTARGRRLPVLAAGGWAAGRPLCRPLTPRPSSAASPPPFSGTAAVCAPATPEHGGSLRTEQRDAATWRRGAPPTVFHAPVSPAQSGGGTSTAHCSMLLPETTLAARHGGPLLHWAFEPGGRRSTPPSLAVAVPEGDRRRHLHRGQPRHVAGGGGGGNGSGDGGGSDSGDGGAGDCGGGSPAAASPTNLPPSLSHREGCEEATVPPPHSSTPRD